MDEVSVRKTTGQRSGGKVNGPVIKKGWLMRIKRTWSEGKWRRPAVWQKSAEHRTEASGRAVPSTACGARHRASPEY